MKIHDVIQGSPEWFAVRAGIPTASEFDKICTPTGKASTQADKYSNRLIAEIMTGGPVESWEGNMWSDRGKELEADAVRFYELQRDLQTEVVGFCTDDARTMGASPDRLVGVDGLLEVKCPSPHVHVEYLLSQKIDQGYTSQVQGQLLVTGRQWVDLISYHPTMPPVIMRIERDEKYLATMLDMLAAFTKDLEYKRQRMISLGYLTNETMKGIAA